MSLTPTPFFPPSQANAPWGTSAACTDGEFAIARMGIPWTPHGEVTSHPSVGAEVIEANESTCGAQSCACFVRMYDLWPMKLLGFGATLNGSQSGAPELDDVDLEILRLLQADGRVTHAAIGKAVDLTGPSVYSRIKRMERDGVIRGYTTLIDPRALRQDLVALMRVGTQADDSEQQPFETFVRNEPQVLECHDVDGEDSYVLKIRTESPQSLRRLLARIRGIPGVSRTVTSIALETVKEPTASAHLSDPEPLRSKETPS